MVTVDRPVDRGDVLDIMVASDQPAISAQQIADKTPVSRQQIHSMLQSMEGDFVKRVEIGPAVGWYISGHQDLHAESMFEGKSIGARSMPYCETCESFIEEGDRVAVLFERHEGSYTWEHLDVVHSKHVVDAVEVLDELPHGRRVAKEQVLDYDMSHAVVHGDVSMVDVEQSSGRVIEQPIIENVVLRELVRPRGSMF